jgi:hypothetical protein
MVYVPVSRSCCDDHGCEGIVDAADRRDGSSDLWIDPTKKREARGGTFGVTVTRCLSRARACPIVKFVSLNLTRNLL